MILKGDECFFMAVLSYMDIIDVATREIYWNFHVFTVHKCLFSANVEFFL